MNRRTHTSTMSKGHRRGQARLPRVLRGGQGALEYAVMFVAVILVILFVQIYFKRALTGRYKDASDQVGEQFSTNVNYNVETLQQSLRREATGPQHTNTGNLDTTLMANRIWSSSRVTVAADFTGNNVTGVLQNINARVTNYRNAELTEKDFVNAVALDRNRGNHASFDSGRLANTNIFNDQ